MSPVDLRQTLSKSYAKSITASPSSSLSGQSVPTKPSPGLSTSSSLDSQVQIFLFTLCSNSSYLFLKPKCCVGSIGSGTGSYSTGNCIGKRFKMFVKNYYPPPAPLPLEKLNFVTSNIYKFYLLRALNRFLVLRRNILS